VWHLGGTPIRCRGAYAADPARSWAGSAGVLPAVDFASRLIPELIELGAGGLLFVGVLTGFVPMLPHGGFALWSAALRNYAESMRAR
jgi:hypothetical protein